MAADRTVDALTTTLRSLESVLLSGPSLEDFLLTLAGSAARLVEPSASSGITTYYDGNPRTLVTSDRRAAQVDELQYETGLGPCLHCLATGEIVDVPDLSTDPRWGDYGKRAVEMGVQCSLSVPLMVDGHTVAALNIYGYDQPRSIGPEQQQRALVLADQATSAIGFAVRFVKQTEMAEQLEQAMAARSVIDQAIGVLMGQQRCDANTAFELLRTHSQNNNQKLRDVAAGIITRITGHPPTAPAQFETGNPRDSLSRRSTPPE
ncbi:GAF and ANTAR domain-containing protein [Kribbella deserti]|uniref:GAF and ANTAR domain-containing protein n=1 Tax=Kribbella deserti TaxID=1926257 RepID=A0ABV6QGC1_9ACTN